jgi:hypothetical protein
MILYDCAYSLRPVAVRICIAFVLLSVVCLEGTALADQDSTRTPRAGEEYKTTLFGRDVVAPWQDRTHINAFTLGLNWIPDGPRNPLILPFGGALLVRNDSSKLAGDLYQPFGSLYFWRNEGDGQKRLRAVVSGLFNDIRYNRRLVGLGGMEFVATFENMTIPFGRPEYVEGLPVDDVELEWQYVRAGMGIGYRKSIAPWHQDNAVELTATYEPGYLWFDRTANTGTSFRVPQATYEGRGHLRLRVDALERNIMELGHEGFAFGGDVIYGHRSDWRAWGNSTLGIARPEAQDTYLAASFYATAVGGLPFIKDERHRLAFAAYGGIGKDLDRFSAFRLGPKPVAWEWDSLSIPDLPGAVFNEFFVRSYGIVSLRYTYQLSFFAYPYLRANWAWIDRPRFDNQGQINFKMDDIPSVGGGLVMGMPWRSQLELSYTYSFGMFRNATDTPERGGHAAFVVWSKGF